MYDMCNIHIKMYVLVIREAFGFMSVRGRFKSSGDLGSYLGFSICAGCTLQASLLSFVFIF